MREKSQGIFILECCISSGYRWRHPCLLYSLKMTLQRLLLTKPRCRSAREFAGGGSELWRPRSQTCHLLTAYFGHPLRQAYVRLGRHAGEGGGQGSLRFSWFPSRRPWFGGVFFVMGGRIRVESTVSMVQRSGDKTHKSFAKRQEKSRVMAT
jgi:hypothetical protein